MRRLLPSSLPTHQLLFVKLLHFMTCLAGASWGRYQGIYLNTQRQLTPLQNGAVRAAGLAAKLLLTPCWGAWADSSGNPRRLLIVSVLLCAGLFDCYRWDSTYRHQKYEYADTGILK
jgi:hypothetical protein